MSELIEMLRMSSETARAYGYAGRADLFDDAADEIERLTAQLAEARQAERAAVVAFVREQASNADARLSECTRDLSAQHFVTAYVTCSRLIADIEAGEHLA